MTALTGQNKVVESLQSDNTVLRDQVQRQDDLIRKLVDDNSAMKRENTLIFDQKGKLHRELMTASNYILELE